VSRGEKNVAVYRDRGPIRTGILVAALALAAVASASNAHAEGLGSSSWFPLVDPAVGAEETFELNTLGIIREGAQWRVVRGKYRASVSHHDFFRTVGRPDLDTQDASRRFTHNALLLGGYGVAAVGVGLLFAKAVKGGFDPPWAVGGGILAGGCLAVWVSGAFEDPALSPSEADELASRYNEQLRLHLEQPERAPRIVAQRRMPLLFPWVSSSAGGMAASLTF
jgi:hypothetical protein